eukprot:1137631-Pelagomonas_calceolata.AAC.2
MLQPIPPPKGDTTAATPANASLFRKAKKQSQSGATPPLPQHRQMLVKAGKRKVRAQGSQQSTHTNPNHLHQSVSSTHFDPDEPANLRSPQKVPRSGPMSISLSWVFVTFLPMINICLESMAGRALTCVVIVHGVSEAVVQDAQTMSKMTSFDDLTF